MTAISALRLHAVQTAARPAVQISRSTAGDDFAQLLNPDDQTTPATAPVGPLPRGGDTSALREPGSLSTVGPREPGTSGAQGGYAPDSPPTTHAMREPYHLPSVASDPISQKPVRELDVQRPEIQFAAEPYPFRESSVEAQLRAAVPVASARARDI